MIDLLMRLPLAESKTGKTRRKMIRQWWASTGAAIEEALDVITSELLASSFPLIGIARAQQSHRKCIVAGSFLLFAPLFSAADQGIFEPVPCCRCRKRFVLPRADIAMRSSVRHSPRPSDTFYIRRVLDEFNEERANISRQVQLQIDAC